MMAFDFTVCALAVWRITYLLSNEYGPGDVFERLRRATGSSWVGRVLNCFYCLSLWVAAPFAAWLATDAVHAAVTWLALSGAASLARKMTDRRRELVGAPAFEDDTAVEPAAEPALQGDASGAEVVVGSDSR